MPALVGWREWVALPELGVSAIKAKVDTGARTSALHARNLRVDRKNGVEVATFDIQPVQRRATPRIAAAAEVIDWRDVMSSAGVRERRPVIVTDIELSGQRFAIELTLTKRDQLGFRMLLGRKAIAGRFHVNPGRSFLSGMPARHPEEPR